MALGAGLGLPWQRLQPGKLGFIFALGCYDTQVENVEDSGLFFFVGISFSLLASFVGKILCSLIPSWWTGTVSWVPGKRSRAKDSLKCQSYWARVLECAWELPQI